MLNATQGEQGEREEYIPSAERSRRMFELFLSFFFEKSVEALHKQKTK